MKTGVNVTIMKKGKILPVYYWQQAGQGSGFSVRYWIFKTGLNKLKKEKVDCPERVAWFFKGIGITFWTVLDIGMSRKSESSVSINFLMQMYSPG
jgi:hypothetical protein